MTQSVPFIIYCSTVNVYLRATVKLNRETGKDTRIEIRQDVGGVLIVHAVAQTWMTIRKRTRGACTACATGTTTVGTT
jgi:Fe-S cluster biogenesis protein NfuA